MQTGYKVGDVMTKKPIAIRPSTTIVECAKVMESNHVGALVVKEGKKVTGILTEQDIVRKVIPNVTTLEGVLVGEHMATDLFTIPPDADIYEAITIMRDENIRHLPVIHNDEIIGLVTLKDILKIQPALFDLMIERFELREEQNKRANF